MNEWSLIGLTFMVLGAAVMMSTESISTTWHVPRWTGPAFGLSYVGVGVLALGAA
jgi:hypothetical protein